jgi:hypothetical protein
MRERLDLLQWYGVFGGAGAWALQLILGFAATQHECGMGGAPSGVGNDLWQTALIVLGAVVVVAAEGAAAVVFLRTRDTRADDPPPHGRLHFLAGAALVANVLFFVMIVLGGVAAISGALCTPA